MPYNHIVRRRRYRPTEGVEAARESALQAILHLLQPVPNLSLVHRRELLTICLWKWTEAAGVPPYAKYNLRYATPGALNHEVPALVNHEHVWPRQWIINRLLKAKAPWRQDTLRSLLEEHGVACVVTVDEHARLGAASGEGWQRYTNAGIDVWDLADSGPMSPPDAVSDGRRDQLRPQRGQRVEAVPEEVGQSAGARNRAVDAAFDERSGERADLLKRLAEAGRLAGGACLIGQTHDGSVGKYVRLHEALIGEPSRAAAFIHWRGRVSLALRSEDLPPFLLQQPSVGVRVHPTYGIRCLVTDETSLNVAENLAVLALDKIREAYSGAGTVEPQ